VQLVDYHSRLARAENPDMADIWNPMSGAVTDHFFPHTPLHRVNMGMHYIGAAAAGVRAWAGIGTTDMRGRMGEIAAKLRRIEEFFGGTSLAHCAVHLSQNTRDFHGHRRDKLAQYSEGLFGAYSILAQEQTLFNFVLDDHLEEGELLGAKVLVCPNSVCLSDRQLASIEAFAREGGLVIAWFDSGRCDEDGEPRPVNPLAELAGVRPGDDILGPKDADRRALKLARLTLDDNLEYVIAGAPARPFDVCADDCIVEASTAGGEARPAIVSRKVGKGEIVWLESDVGAAYHRTPHLELRQLLAALVARREADIAIEAPSVVIANAFLRRDLNAVFVHLVNLPFASNRCADGRQSPTVDEILPIYDVRIAVRGRDVRGAGLRMTDAELELREDGGAIEVVVPGLDWYEAVEFRLA